MFITPLTTSQIDAYNKAGTSTAKSAGPQAEQDKFMTMLVAQLNNQDPLNPMDNAQMTSQMAQINTVSGIQQLNKTMADVALQFGSLQALQGVSLIGRTAVVEGNVPRISGDAVAGGFELSEKADSVEVSLLGKAGQLLGTANLGASQPGQQFFDLPLDGVDPASVGSFTVTATVGKSPLAVKTLELMPVSAVTLHNGGLKLTGSSGTHVSYDQVLGYR